MENIGALSVNPDPTLSGPVRPIRQGHGPEALEGQAHGPSIFLGVLRSGVSLSNPDPSTHRPFRQAQGPEALEGQAQGGEEDRTTMLRVMVRYSNHEVLEGSANHDECSYEPRGDTCAIRVTSAQDRICLDYLFRIGV